MLKNFKVSVYLIFVLVTLCLMPSAFGAISPVAINIFAPVQFPPEDFSVTGVRATALFGHQRNMYGIDIAAIGNMTDLEFAGIAVAGGFNLTHGNTSIIGAQVAGITNVNVQKTTVVGVQVAAVNNNQADSTIIGLQVAPIANVSSHTTIYGFEVGLYNKAYEVNGFQIGLLNFTTSLHGLQIGLLNFNEKGLFSVCPVLNVGF